jgi:hypothetical protein
MSMSKDIKVGYDEFEKKRVIVYLDDILVCNENLKNNGACLEK